MRSGTHRITSMGAKGSLLRILSVRLSVTMKPPSSQPTASSKEPVTVTRASLAHWTPSSMMSMMSASAPWASYTALMAALQTELELFSPRDGGISEEISRA